MVVTIPVSWGELFDKLTILEIKKSRIDDDRKLVNISKELKALQDICKARQLPEQGLQDLVSELHQINDSLWQIEDDIRNCERNKDFSEQFINLARSVYKTNDKRAELKHQINTLLGSELVEEKSYQPY